MRTCLLDEDPELGRWLSPTEVVEARRRSMAAVLRLPPGAWNPRYAPVAVQRHLGFLCLDGLLARDEVIAHRKATELVGPGDLVQPWVESGADALVPHTVTWTALEQTRLAVLGEAFVAATEPWPELRSALLARAVQRCARVSTHHALCQLSRVDARLLVLFWHLADRWGRVVPGGVLLELMLSHESLGRLVGAKRPTVTLALQRLMADDLVSRRTDGCWVLMGSPERGLARLGAAKSPRGQAVAANGRKTSAIRSAA